MTRDTPRQLLSTRRLAAVAVLAVLIARWCRRSGGTAPTAADASHPPSATTVASPRNAMRPPPHRLLAPIWLGALAIGAAVIVGATLFATSMASDHKRHAVARAMTGGDPARAPDHVRRFGCGGCHTIPGIDGADGKVAAPLAQMRERVFIGGVLRNTPDNLVGWIVEPQAYSAHSAMPRTGIDARQARDVAAYLYAQ